MNAIKAIVYAFISISLVSLQSAILTLPKKVSVGQTTKAKKTESTSTKSKRVAVVGDLPKEIKGSQDFLKALQSASAKNQSIMAKCYAESCGFCKQVKIPFEEIAKAKKGKVTFLNIDVENEKNRDILKALNVQGVPTWVCIKVGGMTKAKIENLVNALE